MRILFTHGYAWPYVQRDLSILGEHHEVRECHFRSLRDLPMLIQGLQWCDLTYSWFGKLHALFAVLLARAAGKKSAVVAGGDDVASEPQIGYGMHCHWRKRWCPLMVFRYADLILPVSMFNAHEAIQNAGADPAKISVIHHGFDPTKYTKIGNVAKDDFVLTVGGLNSEYVVRKGLHLFVQSAAFLPDVPFAIVGKWGDSVDALRSAATDNVDFVGPASNGQLLTLYSRARVYVQASIHEAFGCAVAESMLCECVPVVSRRAALPEVVGNSGFYVDELTPEAVAAQVKHALSSDLGQQARARIIHEFPLEKRRAALLTAVQEVMSG